jgi:hypothetical protein
LFTLESSLHTGPNPADWLTTPTFAPFFAAINEPAGLISRYTHLSISDLRGRAGRLSVLQAAHQDALAGVLTEPLPLHALGVFCTRGTALIKVGRTVASWCAVLVMGRAVPVIFGCNDAGLVKRPEVGVNQRALFWRLDPGLRRGTSLKLVRTLGFRWANSHLKRLRISSGLTLCIVITGWHQWASPKAISAR